MKILLLLFLAVLPQQPQAAVSTQNQLPESIAKWEDDIQKLEALNKTEETSSDSILYFGSSSIRLWRSIKNDMAPWPAIQRGYGGAKLVDAVHYGDRVVGHYLGAGNPKRCKAVVIFVANDIAGKDADASPAEVGNRFRQLHQIIRRRDATIPVFWIEVTPCNSRWKNWPQIQQATAAIQNVLDPDPYAYLIPTAGAFLGLDGKPRSELFVEDQLHLNESGYKLWASIIKANLHQRLGAIVAHNSGQ